MPAARNTNAHPTKARSKPNAPAQLADAATARELDQLNTLLRKVMVSLEAD